MTYTAVIKQVSEGWIGWIEELPGVNCQENEYDSLIESLRETLKEAIALNKEAALASAGRNYQELAVSV